MLEAIAAFLVKTTVILGVANGVCSIRGLSAAERHAAASIGVVGVAMVGVFSWFPAWNLPVPVGLVPGDWVSPVQQPVDVAGSVSASGVVEASKHAAPWTWMLTIYIGVAVVLAAVSGVRQYRIVQRVRHLPVWRGRRPLNVDVRTEACGTPWTWGTRRPVIVLPRGFDAWPTGRQRTALDHEVGHIRRRDWLIDQVSEWLCIAFWFQPLIWITWLRQRGYAERACDDVVLTLGGDPFDYAESLLAVARDNRQTRMLAMTGNRSPLTVRIEAILARDARRRPMTMRKRGVFALLALTVAFPVGTVVVTATQYAGVQLTSTEARALEQRLLRYPHDVTLRVRLLGHYQASRHSDASASRSLDRHAGWLRDNAPLGNRGLATVLERGATAPARADFGWHASMDSSDLAITGCCTCHSQDFGTPVLLHPGQEGGLATKNSDGDSSSEATQDIAEARQQGPRRGPAC